MGLDLEVIQDGQEEVRDGQRNAAYQLRLEVYFLSGLGIRGHLAGRRCPPGEPLRRGEVTLSNHLLDVAAGDVRAMPVAFVRVWLLFQGLQRRQVMVAAGGFYHRRCGDDQTSGGTTTELAGFATASLDAAIDGDELLLADGDTPTGVYSAGRFRLAQELASGPARRRLD